MGKQEGKKLTKTKNKHQRRAAQNQREGASPSPSGGGDVRGNGGIWVAEQVSNTASLSPKVVPPQAPLYLCSERKRVEFLFKLD